MTNSYETFTVGTSHEQQTTILMLVRITTRTRDFFNGIFILSFQRSPNVILPEVFINNKFFTFNEEIHNYETRTKTNIHLYHSNTMSGLRTIKHKAAVLWNELPPSIQNMKSISNFKKKN